MNGSMSFGLYSLSRFYKYDIPSGFYKDSRVKWWSPVAWGMVAESPHPEGAIAYANDIGGGLGANSPTLRDGFEGRQGGRALLRLCLR